MPFTLKVEFAGLCLHLEEKERKRVGVVMPDCRRVLGNKMQHADRTRGVPHVGYLRFDLTNLAETFHAGAPTAGPQSEVVYRFDRQEVKFNLTPTGDPVDGELELPRMEEIANEVREGGTDPVPLLEPRPGLFARNVGEAPVVMRTVLEGGKLSAEGKEYWGFPSVLRRGISTPYVDDFRSVATWTRPVDDTDELTITIADLNGENPEQIRLRPTTPGGVIPLKIANLCAKNPLEWEELPQRLVAGNDVDFKWLFRLLRPTNKRTYEELLADSVGALREFPIPVRLEGGGLGRQDCFGAVMSVDSLPEQEVDNAFLL
jgi:hypothetical protein